VALMTTFTFASRPGTPYAMPDIWSTADWSSSMLGKV
jgi:hypothetical protein